MTVIRKRVVQFAWMVPAVFYIATMARTIGYVDAGLVLNNAYFLEISAWVNNHNLFSLLGWLWIRIVPFGTEFFRLNLMSALFGAFTVYFVFRACIEYTGSLWASGVTGVALMLSHSLWWHSTMVEVYALNTLLLALIVFSVARYYAFGRKLWLYAALLFWGLGVSNHVLMGLLAIAFLVLVIAERKNLTPVDVGIGIACLLAGLSVFIIAFVKSYMSYGSLLQVLRMATGGNFRSMMFSGKSGLFWWLNYLGLLVYQYPSLSLLYIAVGTFSLIVRRQKLDLIILAALAPFVVWSANYFVWDMFAFSLPVYILLAFPMARGLVAMKHRRALLVVAIATIAIPLLLYPTAPKTRAIREYVGRYEMSAMVDDTFDPADYFLNPLKTGFNQVDTYVRALFEKLPPDAWYFDNVHDYPIRYYYQEIRGERRDLGCPVVYAFWVTETEIANTARRINSLLQRGQPVFANRFVFETTRAEIVYSGVEPLRVGGQEIYRLY